MKKMLATTALTLMLVLAAGVSAASAKGKKHTPEHVAAIKQCDADYKAAWKEAKTKKGTERSTAEHDARAARKQCMAGAPM